MNKLFDVYGVSLGKPKHLVIHVISRYVQFQKWICSPHYIFLQLNLNGVTEFGEVQFFFLNQPEDNISPAVAYAVVSIYSCPDQTILKESSQTLWVCLYTGTTNLHLVPAKSIISLVSMQPLIPLPDEVPGRWFVVEKSGLDDADLTEQREEE